MCVCISALARSLTTNFGSIIRHRGIAVAACLTQWIDGGVMIVSRHPVSASGFRQFSRCSGGDLFCAKGVVYARVEHPRAGPLHVFTLHLQSSENTYEADASTASERAIRTSQVAEILEFVQESVPGRDVASANIVLAGDWNIDAHAHRSSEKCSLGNCALGRCVCSSRPACSPRSPDGASPEYLCLIKQLRSVPSTLREISLSVATPSRNDPFDWDFTYILISTQLHGCRN